MGKDEFEQLLKDRTERRRTETEIDWDDQKLQWLQYLDEFYATILEFLASYIENGSVEMMERDIPLTEENLGTYNARELSFNIQGERVVFEPIGTLLIGAKGRIDMRSDKGVVRFILVGQHSDRPHIEVRVTIDGKEERPTPKRQRQETVKWVWKIATSPPKISYLELNEDSFFSSLMEILNG